MSKVKQDKQLPWKSILIILLVLTLWAVTLASFIINGNKDIILDLAHLPTSESLEFNDFPNLPADYTRETIHIVFLGFDRSSLHEKKQSLYRPDSIIVASIDINNQEVALVSIPRDSYVKIYGSDVYDKINHSYSYGYSQADDDEDPHKSGLRTTLLTIQDFLGGIPLHEYVVLDIDNAIMIIDSLGGIYYEVEYDVYCLENPDNILVEKGYRHLDGRQFMDYMRNRVAEQGGERGRVERQQKFLVAFFNQIKEEGRLTNVVNLYKAVHQFIETEIKLPRIVSLAIFATKLESSDINQYIFNGKGQLSYRDGQIIWYLLIDEEERVQIIEDAFGVTVVKRPEMKLPEPKLYKPSSENDRNLFIEQVEDPGPEKSEPEIMEIDPDASVEE